MATTTVIYDNIAFYSLFPLFYRPSTLKGVDSSTVLSSQRIRVIGESADGKVGSRTQPPAEAGARAPQAYKAAAGPRSPAGAAGGRRRNANSKRGPHHAAAEGAFTRANAPAGTKAGGPVGPRRRSEPRKGGREHRVPETRRPGRFDQALPRPCGRSATRPTHRGYAMDPPYCSAIR